ncbi:MAG: hypothetical protein JXQ82_01995 [Methanomicrobiaceae archaeon]|nr:hypothetical protein [Methanomicrobiaceae archaeon]
MRFDDNLKEYGKILFKPQGLYSGEHCYYHFVDKKVEKIPDYLSALAQNLPDWSTVQELLDSLLASTGLDDIDELHKSISEIIDQGIIVPKSFFLNNIKKSRPYKKAFITSLVCCTKNRPFELERNIHSYLEHLRGSGRNLRRLLVFDDSDNLKTRDLINKMTLNKLYDTSLPIAYTGHNEKSAFIKLLFKKNKKLPEDIISFALSGDYGANRNASILYTAGEYLLSSDDDTECHFGSPMLQSEYVMVQRETDKRHR